MPMTDTTPHARQPKTILLVEDDQALLVLLRGILELGGYHVLYSKDGEIAARICEQHSSEIDLLVSDMMIPGKNGKDLSLFVHDRWPQIKILLYSGHPKAESMLKELGPLRGGVRFLPKPFNHEVLLRTVRTMLNS